MLNEGTGALQERDYYKEQAEKLQKQRDHFIEVFNLIHQTCEGVLNNHETKESELRTTFEILKVMANKEKSRLDGKPLDSKVLEAASDSIFKEMKGGQP